jgi:hypothetical protein
MTISEIIERATEGAAQALAASIIARREIAADIDNAIATTRSTFCVIS